VDIFLVRHGEAAATWGEDPDPGLSALGEQQAADAAHFLLPRLGTGAKLISSPLQRAQQTAAPLASSLGSELSIDDAFREIPAPAPLAKRKQWLRGFMQQGWAEQPETLLRWRARALQQLHKLKTPTVVFTHFLLLNAVVGSIAKRAETVTYWPDNASVTHLQLTDDGTLELLSLGAQMETVVN
jgi:probable phosphoglycerate mutase